METPPPARPPVSYASKRGDWIIYLLLAPLTILVVKRIKRSGEGRKTASSSFATNGQITAECHKRHIYLISVLYQTSLWCTFEKMESHPEQVTGVLSPAQLMLEIAKRGCARRGREAAAAGPQSPPPREARTGATVAHALHSAQLLCGARCGPSTVSISSQRK